MKELVIRDSSWETAKMLFLYIIFVWAGFYTIKIAPTTLYICVAICVILFFSVGAIVALISLILHQPVAILSEQNLTLPRLFFANKVVAWNEILYIEIRGKKKDSQYIHIQLKDTDLENLENLAFKSSKVTISLATTNYTCEEVLKLLKQYQEFYLQLHE